MATEPPSFKTGFEDSFTKYHNNWNQYRNNTNPGYAGRAWNFFVYIPEIILGLFYLPVAINDGLKNRKITVLTPQSPLDDDTVSDKVKALLAVDTFNTKTIGGTKYFANKWESIQGDPKILDKNTYFDNGDNNIIVRLNDEEGTYVKIDYISCEDLTNEALRKLNPEMGSVSLKRMLFDIVDEPTNQSFTVTKDGKKYHLQRSKYAQTTDYGGPLPTLSVSVELPTK